MKIIQDVILDEYNIQINEIFAILKVKGQLLICGLDSYIINTIIEVSIKKIKKKNLEVVEITSANQKDDDPRNKIFIIKVDDDMPKAYQSLIYYYLEKSKEKMCSLILVSSSCQVLDKMEKRLKSRFNHRIYFFKYLSYVTYKALYNNFLNDNNENNIYKINPSIDYLLKRSLMMKYNIPEYNYDSLFALLSPIHMALVAMVLKKQIKYINAVENFRAFVNTTPELKATKDTDIMFNFLDLIESNIIDKKGELLIDSELFKRYVQKNSPLYIKKLLNRVFK